MSTVYVLTREHNLYDQHGEYFVAVFQSKPTDDQLRTALMADDGWPRWEDAQLALLNKLSIGGGRICTDHSTWYWLNEVEFTEG